MLKRQGKIKKLQNPAEIDDVEVCEFCKHYQAPEVSKGIDAPGFCKHYNDITSWFSQCDNFKSK